LSRLDVDEQRFGLFVVSPVFSADDQSNAIDAVLTKAKITGLVGNFIRVVAKNRLKGVVGKDVAIIATVDPSILGGMIVKVGSKQIDTSLKTRLSSLKLALKEVG